MTMFWTMAAVMYPVLILIYAMNSAQAKPRGGLLFGARLLEYQAKEPAVEAIIARFRRQMRLALVLSAVVPLSFLLIPYMSIQLSAWILWIFAIIVVLYVPYVRANKALRQWKASTGDVTRRERVVYAELGRGLRTLGISTFVPAVLVSVLAVILAGWALRGQGLGVVLFTVASFAVMTPVFGGCAVWMDRQRLKVISADSDVNLNYNRALRGRWKIFWLLGAWLNAVFTLALSLSLLLGGYERGMRVLLYGALVYAVVLVLLTVWLLVEQHRLDRTYRRKMDLVGFSDDDENWLWGLVYYNPGDIRVSVEKRFGVGTTMNMATPAGKAMGVFLALVLAGMVVMCGWMMLEEFTPLRLEVQGDRLVAAQLWGEYDIPLEEAEEVALLEARPEWSRVNGTAMTNLLKGTFRLKENGARVEVFLDPENIYCITLTANGTTYYLSCDTDEETLLLFQQLET